MGKQRTTEIMVECAAMVAMAFVLSFIVIIRLPFGGAVTAASMLPIIIAGYRHGLKWGLITGFAYSLLQLLTGLKNLSYATSPLAALAIIMLDYIVAYTILGIVGWWKRDRQQTSVLVIGTIFVCFLRFVCHVLTGATVWAGVSIPTMDGMLYSIVYNMAYMIPETVVTVYVAALLSNSLDLRKNRPVTIPKTTSISALLYSILIFGIAIVADFIYLFGKIQGKDGFDVTGIKTASPVILGTITMAGVVAAFVVYFLIIMFANNKNEE